MFLEELAANRSMLASIRNAFLSEMPILGECGGYMYLCRQVVSFSGDRYQMADLIPESCQMERSLQTVGYVEAKALTDNLLCLAGESLRGHEFHFSSMLEEQESVEKNRAFLITKNRTGAEHSGGYAEKNLLASYLHMHFAGNTSAAMRFVDKCAAYRQTAKGKK